MKKNEMAVAIARDVLKHLRSLKVRDRNGYVGLNDKYECTPKSLSNLSGKEQLQNHLPVVVKYCDVCALGACFLSYVRLYDKIQVSSLVQSYDFGLKSDKLVSILNVCFSLEQRNLIESAFELNRMDEGIYGTKHIYAAEDAVDYAIEFGKQYEDPKERLRAIMKNIIKNNGQFCPPVPQQMDAACVCT